jgi:hypothetical protein
MAENRTPRENETRAAEVRPAAWMPANSLPDPAQRPGKKFRWVRTSAGGQSDAINVARRLREGYVPVKASEYPELQILSDRDSRFPESVEVGGLLLCSVPEEIARARNDYYRTQTKAQMQAVDSQLMAEQDPRLRTLFRNVKSQTRFGPDARRETSTGASAQLPTNQK